MPLLPGSKGEDVEPAEEAFTATLSVDMQWEEGNLIVVSQKVIILKIDLCKHQLLSEHISTTGVQREVARLSNLQLPHSGDWLNVIPSPSIGLKLRSANTKSMPSTWPTPGR